MFGTSLMLVAAAMAVFVVAAGAVVGGSPSGFESGDGNMALTNTDGTHTDWNCFLGTSAFQAGTPNSNCKVTTGAKDIQADTAGEGQFVGGTKFDDMCPATNTGNNPPKDEFQYIASFSDTDASGFEYFYGATIRATNNGNSSGDVELHQGAGTTATTFACRQAGDRLIAYDFVNGGATLQFHVLTYITPAKPNLGGNAGICYSSGRAIGTAVGCWGQNVLTPDPSTFEGAVNAATISAGTANGISPADVPAQDFAEFGVNLTKMLGLVDSNGVPLCQSFPQQAWESRSAGSSFGSQPQDLEIENQTISNCGTITIIKHTDPRGANQAFSYSTTSGPTPLVPGTFHLNDNGYTGSSTDGPCSTATSTTNMECYGNLQPGTYTVTEGSQAGYSLEGISCTGSGVTKDLSTGKVTVALTAQDNVICTYTNQALGEIKIIKHTSPGGINQDFSFGSTGGLSPSSFTLNDSATNTADYPNLPVGNYTVAETEPAGWTLGSLSCSPSGTTGAGHQDGTNNLQADINLTAGTLVTCTYTNNQPTGAIVITKTGKDKACTGSGAPAITNGTCKDAGHAYLSGAKFSVTGTDLLGHAVSFTGQQTGSDGTVCIAGLPWNGSGNSYNVTETDAPNGYQLDNGSAVSVAVTQDADCGSNKASAATQAFTDTPLSSISVTAKADVAGTTNSSIVCSTDPLQYSNPFINVALTDPASKTQDGLAPNTYYCKVVVDP